MAELGYRGRVRGDRTVYRARELWKPRVIVDHDGWMRFRSPKVTFARIGVLGYDAASAGSGYVPVTSQTSPGAVVQVRFTMTPRPVLDAKERDVSEATHELLADVRGALRERGLDLRLAELPDELQALWDEGVLTTGGFVAGRTERRRLILDLWATRTDTPEGEAVREAVEAFLRAVVQSSPWPCTPEELESARARCPCGRAPAVRSPL
jgi:hypothetical protein